MDSRVPPKSVVVEMIDELELVVARTRMLCADVREIVLSDSSGATLPSFPAGSHIAVEWSPGQRNSYSLTGPSVEPEWYSISVRLDPAGRGGSRWAHELRADDTVTVSPPRSEFAPVATARHHLLLAGGIGVTPILSHVRAAVLWGRSFEVVYAHRSGAAPHLDEMSALCGDRLTVAESRERFWENVTPALARSPLGTHLYVCGPASMVDAVTAAATAAGWPSGRVHSEPFAAGAVTGGTAFTARLARSGTELAVASDISLLDALREHGAQVPSLCGRGVCGECRLTVRGGPVDHRDSYLTDDERDLGDSIMACVSRAAATHLELDL